MSQTLSAGLLSGGGAAVEAALQLASGSGVAPIAGVIAHAGLALALRPGATGSAVAQVVADTSLDQQLGYIAAGGFLIDRALGLSVSAAAGAGASRGTAVAFDLALALGQQAMPIQVLDVAISAGARQALSLLSQQSHQTQVELAATIGQAVAAALDSPGTLIPVKVQGADISVAVQGNTINIE